MRGNPHLKTVLVECAWAATHVKQPGQQYLKDKFYQLASRMGHKKALIAIGHKILIAIYHMLLNKQPYQAPDTAIADKRRTTKQIERMTTKLAALGYCVQPA